MSVPYSYQFMNLYNSAVNPSTVHCKNTALVNYYTRYLLQKVMSVYDFTGLPEEWAENYFKYCLFAFGYLAVFDTERYGVICQECTLSDTYTIFRQPKIAIVTNPLFKKSLELVIGEDCEVIKLQPDYGNVMDIVGTYADLMGLCLETAGTNLLNSKMSYVFFSDNKTAAESFKKMYDKLASGEPMAVIDKNLMNNDGTKSWDFFMQNVGQNFIVDKVMDTLKNLEDQFNTRVGIPNANTQKRERLITDEVKANDVDTKSLVSLWLDTMRKDIAKVNRMFNLSMAVNYRYEQENEPEVTVNE